MKDLMDFCREHKAGPIEGLKNYPQHATAAKLQMQEMEQLGLPTDRNTLNKLMAQHPGMNSQMGNSHQMVGRGALSGSAQAALALSSYQNLLMRQNSMNSNSNSLHQEASPSFNNSNQNPSSTFQGPTALLPGTLQNLPSSGFSNSQLPQQQQMQQRSLNGNGLLQQNHPQPSQGSQALQQHMIQQLLQDMKNNTGGGVQQQSHAGQNANGSVGRDGMGFGSNPSAATAASVNGPGSIMGPTPSRSNSFKAASNIDSSAAGGNNGFNQKAPDLSQNLHLSDEMVQDIAHDFTENGFFNSDLEDNMSYCWKA
uniref:Putative SEUSS-like 2 n=1 Tax=Davidia involucrata TaxID=16924 RepID=A0A5B7AIB5_DAVIN